MASPAAENMQNGISTPPATANAPTLSPPTQQPPPTQAQQQQQQPSQQQSQTNGGTNPNTTATTAAAMNPAFPGTSLSDPGTSKRPRDARLIHLILANMGVHAYTERVPLQLLDFAYRYTSSILSDAISYEPPLPTTSGSKKRAAGGGAAAGEGDSGEGVSLAALRTAVGARAAGTFQATLGKEFMSEVAQERNRIALPRVEREFGIRLPPERYCFTGVGWGVKGAWEDDEVVDEGVGDEDEMDLDGGGGAGNGGGGFGGGPVGAITNGGRKEEGEAKDTDMGGMEEEEEADDEEFEEAMGINRENNP
ncbi:transcription initiation factor tfiid subunit 9 [Alternaria burnsii]|uniref:Transcription initiation factor tfiid subunit 9 n=1 Tax=Alternaria burnsii TaxID=1187904 RepID=A0A8H7EB41_9PLEO|nr:transcription initiation factor tfiid subunit 9 [Alternaria burnsii]KAF7671057.1 transcription initiation factor tfiid subunit 9 [Alternaria burnsii]